MPNEWKSDKEKAEALNNSRPFDVHRWSDFPEVNAAVEHIYEKLNEREDFRGRKSATRRNVKIVVNGGANLVHRGGVKVVHLV